jgi:hypothetical protein
MAGGCWTLTIPGWTPATTNALIGEHPFPPTIRR